MELLLQWKNVDGKEKVMKAVVSKVNFKRGWVAYEMDEYDYGWLEILDTIELEEGDIIEGQLTDLGQAYITKVGTNEKIDVFIEDYGMNYKKAIEMIMR